MEDKNFIFWYRWLLVISVLSVLVGLSIAFLSNSVFFHIYNAKLTAHFFDGQLPEGVNEMRLFLFGPIGGTITGYFVFQTFIVWNSFYNKERWAWYSVLAALTSWFVVDTTVSLIHAAYFNILMINLPTLLLNGIPLLKLHQFFR